MFSFDGDNISSGKSKTSSANVTSKKSSEKSVNTNLTMDFPNTPNFNPTWKKKPEANNRRRFAHFFKKSYFKQLSRVIETPEESKDDDYNQTLSMKHISKLVDKRNSNLSGIQSEDIDYSSSSLSDNSSNSNTNIDQGS